MPFATILALKTGGTFAIWAISRGEAELEWKPLVVFWRSRVHSGARKIQSWAIPTASI